MHTGHTHDIATHRHRRTRHRGECGIGHATARALAAQGASVALVARRQGRLETLAAQIEEDGGTAVSVPADITEGFVPPKQ